MKEAIAIEIHQPQNVVPGTAELLFGMKREGTRNTMNNQDDMNNFITYRILLSNSFDNFALFEKDLTPWKIIKIGDIDNDYEPGYISEINFAEMLWRISENTFIDTFNVIVKEIPKIEQLVTGNIDSHCILGKQLHVHLGLSPNGTPPDMFLSHHMIDALAKNNIEMRLWFDAPFYLVREEKSGRMFLKYEKEIIEESSQQEGAPDQSLPS